MHVPRFNVKHLQLTVEDYKRHRVSFNEIYKESEWREGYKISKDETSAEADHSLLIGKLWAKLR